MFGFFSKIIQWTFSSFNISEDTNLVSLLKDSGIQNAMIIKRAVIFGYFISGRLLIILLLMIVNIYLLLSFFGYGNLGYWITGIYTLGIIYGAFLALHYLVVFRRTHGKENRIMDIAPLIEQLEKCNKAFGRFFNQAMVNYILLITVGTLSIVIIFLDSKILENWLYLLGIIPIIVVQFVLLSRYVKRMIDLAMDFNVIVPGKILFYNQRSMWGTSQTMEADKIKTVNSSVNGVLQSFFGYGNIIVLTEGDEAQNGEMSMYFVTNPKQTVLEIYKLLDGTTKASIESIEELLEKIHLEEKNTGKISEETKKDIHLYLESHESELKEMFEAGDEVTKNDIKELYIHVEGK